MGSATNSLDLISIRFVSMEAELFQEVLRLIHYSFLEEIYPPITWNRDFVQPIRFYVL